MNSFKLSIIIPSFNSAKFIERCLHSIDCQLFTETGGVECLIISDCSTDNSLEIIERYVNNYNGGVSYKIINNEINKGVAYSRNRGVDLATGEYILFVDADDELAKGWWDIFNHYINLYPEADLYIGSFMELGGPICTTNEYPKEEWQLPDDIDEFISKYSVTPWNKIIRRNFILKYNLYFKTGILSEDIHWSFRFITHIKKLITIPQVTYKYYTFQSGCATNHIRSDRERDLSNQLKLYNSLCQSIIDRKDDKIVEAVLKNRFHHFKNAIIEYSILGKNIKSEYIECYNMWAKYVDPAFSLKKFIIDLLINHPNNFLTRKILSQSIKYHSSK